MPNNSEDAMVQGPDGEVKGMRQGDGEPAWPAYPPPRIAGLTALHGFPFLVWVSPGGEGRGQIVAERATRTVAWLAKSVPMPETPPLFVVGPDHWSQVATFPGYGMPHEGPDRIVVGQEPAGFWTTVLSSVTSHVDEAGMERLRAVYGETVDLSAFADLLVCHELTHLSNLMVRWPQGNKVHLWLNELAANIGMHGYITEVEPELTETLEAAVEVTWAAVPKRYWPFHDLQDMEHSLGGDASNYVWYEFGTQVLAKRLWETAGVAALQRVNEALRGPALDFKSMVDLLSDLDPWSGQAARAWPDFPLPPTGSH